MLCKRPYRVGAAEFGCGKCKPCGINRRRLWTGRMLLESVCHKENIVATMTYAHTTDSLEAGDLVMMVKRLRKLSPQPVRYFGCGEYGDRFGRPHFHVAFFGLGIDDEEKIIEAWQGGKWLDPKRQPGDIHVMELNNDTAQYLTGYVTKKIGGSDHEVLAGNFPEFARMSRRPGLGQRALQIVAESLMAYGGAKKLADVGDVPSSIRIAGKHFPLGRYLRCELRKLVGWDGKAPSDTMLKTSREVLLEGPQREKRRYCHEVRAEFLDNLSKSMRRF